MRLPVFSASATRRLVERSATSGSRQTGCEAGSPGTRKCLRSSRRYSSSEWKAARRLMTDDGFNLGILYRGERKPFQPARGANDFDLAELEKEFEQ